jgi:hypothetical protein
MPGRLAPEPAAQGEKDHDASGRPRERAPLFDILCPFRNMYTTYQSFLPFGGHLVARSRRTTKLVALAAGV